MAGLRHRFEVGGLGATTEAVVLPIGWGWRLQPLPGASSFVDPLGPLSPPVDLPDADAQAAQSNPGRPTD